MDSDQSADRKPQDGPASLDKMFGGQVVGVDTGSTRGGTMWAGLENADEYGFAQRDQNPLRSVLRALPIAFDLAGWPGSLALKTSLGKHFPALGLLLPVFEGTSPES